MEEQTENTSKLNPIMIAVVVVIIAVAGFFLMRTNTNTQTSQPGQTAQPTTPQASPEASTMGNEVKTITVEAGAFYFNPKEIRVKKGEKVKIVLTAKDMMHDFTIDELKVKLPVTKASETNSVKFTADQAGQFEYYCSVGQHRANGQVGKLIVE